MADIVNLKSIIPGKRNLQLVSVDPDDRMLATCTADHILPEWKAKRLAERMYRAANDPVLKAGQERIANLKYQQKYLRQVFEKKASTLVATAGPYRWTPSSGRKGYRLDLRTWLMTNLFEVFRLALLMVTIMLIAMYVRASDYSADLSSSWPMALAFGFPVLLFSYVLGCVADGFDDVHKQRRVAFAYTAIGSIVLMIWLVATASIFRFDVTSASQGFSLGLDAVAGPLSQADVPAALAEMERWATFFFPQSVSGSLLLLLHVTGDVFVGAAAAVWAKLAFKTGRKSKLRPREDHADWVNEHAEAKARLAEVEAELEYLAGIEDEYKAGRSKARAMAATLLPHLKQRMKAERLMAHTNAVETLRKAS